MAPAAPDLVLTMVVVTWLTLSSVNEPTWRTVVCTKLEVATWVVPAASE